MTNKNRMEMLSILGSILGEGGVERYVDATTTDKQGNKVNFKASLKEADECGAYLDPEGPGLHCASTGRTKYMEIMSWILFLVSLLILIHEIYNQGLFPGQEKKKVKEEFLITYSVFIFISLCYFLFFISLKYYSDNYNYGTTDFWMGTKTISNSWGTESVNDGKLLQILKNTDYKEGIDDQVKEIINKFQNSNKINLSNYKNLSIYNKIKEYVDKNNNINLQQLEKQFPEIFLQKYENLSNYKEIQEYVNKNKNVTHNEIDKKFVKLSNVKKPEKPNELKKEGQLLKKELLKKEFGKKIYGESDGLGGFSEAGHCDICNQLTGSEDGSGKCVSTHRCWISVVIYSIFFVYFVSFGIYIILEEEEKNENDKIFRIFTGSLCLVISVICFLSIFLMLWSIYYCPSGSQFVRKTFLGYEASFRW